MFRTDGDIPVTGYGPLTLNDLAERAERARVEHMETYTATEVMHRALMAEPDYDGETAALVDAAVSFIKEFRKKTRVEWRATYRNWATAAGVEIPPDDDEAEDVELSDAETEV
ncbi:hypothetical protein [Pseudofrankia inefficax]|uniref:Xylem cysteine proteinase 2 n=1 Tax=Pseudofrankia inefficax (strain DSM 45817 / CECT 9037 / DDB 130130 / EuI1c) TaxID=298654 RepID=E3J8T4_PSEI1|nr:hypothetical protein [Pseudofrankia inefficax]ADP79667.1 xylem cysteine proteinase 2 [Pseudofrankia inefficax]